MPIFTAWKLTLPKLEWTMTVCERESLQNKSDDDDDDDRELKPLAIFFVRLDWMACIHHLVWRWRCIAHSLPSSSCAWPCCFCKFRFSHSHTHTQWISTQYFNCVIAPFSYLCNLHLFAHFSWLLFLSSLFHRSLALAQTHHNRTERIGMVRLVYVAVCTCRMKI